MPRQASVWGASLASIAAQAQATGKLLLSLRGAEDDAVLGQIEVDQDQLLDQPLFEDASKLIEKMPCDCGLQSANGRSKGVEAKNCATLVIV